MTINCFTRARRFVLAGVAALAAVSGAQAGVTGACCLPGGGCDDLFIEECDAVGGGFVGEGTDCATSDCDNITGGCCLSEEAGGNCISTTFDICLLEGGVVWTPFVDCANACPGACCINGSGCDDLSQFDCETSGGFFQGNGTDCGNTPCLPFGACCLPTGDCELSFEVDCDDMGGTYQGDGTDCSSVVCPDAVGGCCFATGDCLEASQSECDGMGGIYQGDLTGCEPNDCPQPTPTGACCLLSGDCQPNETEADCLAIGGTYNGDGTACDPNPCDQPPVAGACCFFDGSCQDLFEADCDDAGGHWQGALTICGADTCPEPELRASGTEKGSLLMFSQYVVQTGDIMEGPMADIHLDTFIQLTNDSPEPVRVLMYWVNGRRPEPGYPGWNYIDVEVTLTGNQTMYWSVATGEGTMTLPPISVLSPGEYMPPAGDGDEGSFSEGFIYAFAVDPVTGLEKTHNHLTGTATIVDYYAGAAASYNAMAYRRRSNEVGNGELMLDGAEYDESYAQLVLNFMASGSSAWSSPSMSAPIDTLVTLHPAGADFRPDAPGLPISTKANYDVWNENEVKLSGAYQCVTCWDSRPLSDYGIPNHFTLQALQTDAGKARIIGRESALCNGDGFVSEDAALVGVMFRFLRFGAPVGSSTHTFTGNNLIGIGADSSASIRYTPLDVPPEAPASDKKISGKRSRLSN